MAHVTFNKHETHADGARTGHDIVSRGTCAKCRRCLIEARGYRTVPEATYNEAQSEFEVLELVAFGSH